MRKLSLHPRTPVVMYAKLQAENICAFLGGPDSEIEIKEGESAKLDENEVKGKPDKIFASVCAHVEVGEEVLAFYHSTPGVT